MAKSLEEIRKFNKKRNNEYTVDFIHPTDLGFFKMAEGLYPVIKEIIN